MSTIRVGDFVYVRKDLPRLRDYQGRRGEVVRVIRSAITVRFPEETDDCLTFVRLTLNPSELVKEDQR